ncbi:MAG: class I SAM-dependent methyltransferase [Deltaproteobacteria bacterium]|nr:class I SAM-dependent methyltransferase [Deltaproteobacteria bacterium]MBW1953125.1 class I SAM-dependent methyltransferase [Deltaproteobacteria bacterium]MBW1987003.1 class I SAM-dependent methyltransferase [Deltaproteobacteria bacterium]MBW2134040.1 class I SAM-dependent methyltransferase [Deltaproteobacteria bacterium]
MEAIPGPFAYYYDWISDNSYFRRLYRLLGEDLQKALPPGGLLLDIGTGPGRLLLGLATQRTDIRALGLDLSPPMVTLAHRRLLQAHLSDRVAVLAATATALPFPAQVFDLAVATMSYHHWRNPSLGLQELLRVLKPEGRAWLYELDRNAGIVEIRAFARQQHQSFYLTFTAIRLVALHSALRAQDFEWACQQAGAPFWQIEKVHHIFWRAEIRPQRP